MTLGVILWGSRKTGGPKHTLLSRRKLLWCIAYLCIGDMLSCQSRAAFKLHLTRRWRAGILTQNGALHAPLVPSTTKSCHFTLQMLSVEVLFVIVVLVLGARLLLAFHPLVPLIPRPFLLGGLAWGNARCLHLRRDRISEFCCPRARLLE